MPENEINVSGTLIWYYYICKREVWLISHQLTPDQENTNIAIGRIIDATSYSREKKQLAVGASKMDIYRLADGKLIIGEVKKSSKYRGSARMQLGFYLKELAARGIEATGELRFPEEKTRELVELDEEDLALAYEADEMSLLEPDDIPSVECGDMFETFEPEVEAKCTEPLGEIVSAPAETVDEYHQIEDIEDEMSAPIEAVPSEASQEYGDENAIPIDPALLALPVPAEPAYSTPKRVLSERVCHTVSKVPLKPAADHTPMRPSPIKRSASISKLPIQRPTNSLSRSNTVISYSQTKSTPRSSSKRSSEESIMRDPLATPSKAEPPTWSTMGTPARTPRRDLNTALLKGAVVFVDVHTTEGADASSLFIELLTQMGARCVKSWNWNGNGEDGNKIGITHVVFKDGGKRTLEKVKETNGVVSCVGVGWVLE